MAGLHHGELVCTVRPHISTKGHGVLQRSLRGHWYVRSPVFEVTSIPWGGLPVRVVTQRYRLGPMWLDGRPRW